jgi:polar amino acid transport system substrate-binding protein
MSFTAAYLEIEATYLVRSDSPLRTAADVDRDGVRVAAPARANYELYLSRNLKHARLVSTQGAEAAVDLFVTGQVEALAGLTQALLDRLEQLPGSRLVEGRFMGVQQSIAVPKGREAGLAYLRHVVEDAKASGLVARAIERTGARGVSVAPAAK